LVQADSGRFHGLKLVVIGQAMKGHEDGHQKNGRESEKNHARQKVENHFCQLEGVNPMVDHPLRKVEHPGSQNNEQEDREARQQRGPDFVEDVFVKSEPQAITVCECP
jgi:hypothetical protein